MGGSILPDSYFEGLSALWGGCAYVASAIVAAALAFQAARTQPSPAAYFGLFGKVFLIGIATLFIREWLMRLNDVVSAFNSILGIDPVAVDEKFVSFIAGTTPEDPDSSVWDIIWGTRSIGTAICYALLWLFGWLSWGLQYIVKLIGDVLLTAGWALSPIFLAFFMLRPMASVALKYVIGLAALVCWPFGWTIAAVVTNAMIDASATANLIPVVVPGSAIVAPALTVLLIGAWMIISSIIAPYVTTRILLMGANPVTTLAQGIGGVGTAFMAGGFGGAATAATGGAAAGGVIAAAAVGAMTSGVESAAKGGGAANVTATSSNGLGGMYTANYARRRMGAYEKTAEAFTSMASSARSMAASRVEQAEFFRDAKRRMNRQQRGHDAQPHHDDPNRLAIEIENYAKN